MCRLAVIPALVLFGCAGAGSTNAPPLGATEPAIDESTLPKELQGVPEVDPTETLRINGDSYDVYVWQADGEYDTKVCVRYQQTGSRMRANTCGSAPAQNVSSSNMRGLIAGDLGRHQRLQEDARVVRRTLKNVYNGKVTITDLEGELEKELSKNADNSSE